VQFKAMKLPCCASPARIWPSVLLVQAIREGVRSGGAASLAGPISAVMPGETVTALKKLFKFIAIEMTIPGVLRDGKWRTQDQLSKMSAEEQRKALVEIMKQHAKEPLPHERYREWARQNFQTGYYFETLKDDFLTGIAAVVVFLLRTKIRDHNWLKGNTDGDHRNCLIVENEGHTSIPILDLQQMDNQKNLQIGLDWFNKSFSCVKITHKGDEVFRKTDKTIVPVTHEPVTFQFKYNAQKMIWNEANHYVENPEELLLIGGMDATIVSTDDMTMQEASTP
jgi:hypothetical protein